MKTAILKTEFWQDDTVFELNSDTRFLYLCLLTNPQRDITPAFKCSDRLLSAYTGYSVELISICRQQLIASGRINYIDGYYVFTKQDFVQPSKGRDSKIIFNRYIKELPKDIQDFMKKEGLISTSRSTGTSTSTITRTNTGTSTSVKDKDIDKDNNKYIKEISVLYYQVIKAMRLPTTNHNTIRAKIKILAYEDEPNKIKDYLIFLRDKYSKIEFDYKPAINDALDIYRKRVQISNAVRQEAKNSNIQRVWRASS